MCSCKTKKIGSEVDFSTKENIHTKLSRFESLTDTSNVLKIEIDKSKLKITETITTKKYDKDTGAITEETTTEREIIQDTDKVSTEEKNQAVTECNQLEVDHFADVSKKIDSEVKEESIGGQESFGKWFGIVIGVIVGLLLLYLMRKLRVN
jgi:tetrahydromethanopterin S-methyltransferase subunit G